MPLFTSHFGSVCFAIPGIRAWCLWFSRPGRTRYRIFLEGG